MIKLQLINADIIYDTAIVTSRSFGRALIAGIIREWIMSLVSSHCRVLKNGDPHYLVLQATSITKFYFQGFQSGPVPGTFTCLRLCIVPAEITEPPKISGGQNHKYDGR
jgi:hypothetical protein